MPNVPHRISSVDRACAHCGTPFTNGQYAYRAELELEYGSVAFDVCLSCRNLHRVNTPAFTALCKAVKFAMILEVPELEGRA
jgi:hypothetical protein